MNTDRFSFSKTILILLTFCFVVSVLNTSLLADKREKGSLDTGSIGFEIPPVFQASKILPKEMMSSTLFTIAPEVKNDGYINHFQVQSRFGTFSAKGRPALEKTVLEINALDILEREFPSSKVAGEAATETAKNIVTAPIRGVEKVADTVSDREKLSNTVSAIPSGVVGLFGAAATAVKDGAVFVAETGAAAVTGDSEKTSQQMDKAGNTISKAAGKYSGYSKAYREICKVLKVDPYTQNEILKSELKRVAGIQAGVGIAGKLAPAMVGVPYVGTINSMTRRAERVAAYEDPEKVNKLNADIANTLGFDKGEADPLYSAFVKSSAYTPITRRIILTNLERMKGVKDLKLFLKMANSAKTREGAFFYTVASESLADYHQKKQKFTALVSEVIVPAGVTASGTLMIPLPVDHLVWTRDVATIAKGFEDRVKGYAVKHSTFYISGTASPRARQELRRFGAEEIKEGIGYF